MKGLGAAVVLEKRARLSGRGSGAVEAAVALFEGEFSGGRGLPIVSFRHIERSIGERGEWLQVFWR